MGAVKLIAFGIVFFVILIVGLSLYFAITTPAGQQGLAGMFQQLGNSVLSMVSSFFAPVTAAFNGIAHAITNFFSHL